VYRTRVKEEESQRRKGRTRRVHEEMMQDQGLGIELRSLGKSLTQTLSLCLFLCGLFMFVLHCKPDRQDSSERALSLSLSMSLYPRNSPLVWHIASAAAFSEVRVFLLLQAAGDRGT
jgi:hypothetical protein